MSTASPPAAATPWQHTPLDWKPIIADVEAFLKAEGVINWDDERCGEAFEGDSNEMAHPSCLIGPWKGPVGYAASIAFASPQRGHTPMMAVRRPNVRAPIFTMVVNEVTIGGAKQAVQVGGPLQRAAADAVAHCIAVGVLPKDVKIQRKLAIVFQGFVHWESDNEAKTYWWNYRQMVMCIVRAVTFAPTTDTIIADSGKHAYCACETAATPTESVTAPAP